MGATLAVGFAISTSYANLGESNYKAVLEHMEADRMTRFNEASRISKTLTEASPYGDPVSRKYINSRFIGKVLDESAWASKRLNIPSQFIVAQLLMESGRLQPAGFYFIDKNNLGGIKNGKRPKEFKGLHEFAESYVAILRRDGVHDTREFWGMVHKLHKRRYFVNQSTLSYGGQLLGVLATLKEVSPEYEQYYKNSLTGAHHLTRKERRLYTQK